MSQVSALNTDFSLLTFVFPMTAAVCTLVSSGK